MHEDSVLWEAYEHDYADKSSNWYWVVGIITIAIIIVSILLNDTLFGIVIGLSVLILGYHSRLEPRIVEVEINDRGVRVSNKMYPFLNLESYHIENKDTDPKLILKSKKFWMPLIIIRMDGADVFQAEAKIKKHLPEDFHPEPLAHKLLHRIGF